MSDTKTATKVVDLMAALKASMLRTDAAKIVRQLTTKQIDDILAQVDMESTPPLWCHDFAGGILVDPDGDCDAGGHMTDCSKWSDIGEDVVALLEAGRDD